MMYLAWSVLIFLVAGCSSTIEYGRRSLNEPQFLEPHQPPSLIISSTAQATQKNDTPPVSQDTVLSKTGVRLDFKNPSAGAIAAIKQAFEPSPEKPVLDDNRSVLKRTIVATITRGEFRPADRFVNFRLRIEPINFEFSDYSGTVTDYSSIDIENVSLTTTKNAGLELSGGTPVAAKINLSNERVLAETGDVKTRIENSTTNIDYKTLDIYREAERGIDLSGNTLVNVSVRASQSEADKEVKRDLVVTSFTVRKNEKFLSPEKASLTTAGLLYLRPKDLTARITFNYVIRRVLSKSNEYTEHNQTVSYEDGECTRATAIIVPARDLDVPRWNIEALHLGKKIAPVYIESELGPQPLTFTNYIDALRFSVWMMNVRAARIGHNALSLPAESGLHLIKKTYPQLVVGKSSEELDISPESRLDCKVTRIHKSPPSG